MEIKDFNHKHQAIATGRRAVVSPKGMRRLIQQDQAETFVSISRRDKDYAGAHPATAFDFSEAPDGSIIITPKGNVDPSEYSVVIYGGKRSLIDKLRLKLFGPQS